jgi:hypothetical protein
MSLPSLQHVAHRTGLGLSSTFTSVQAQLDSWRSTHHVITGVTERTVEFKFIGTPFPDVMAKVGDAVTYRDDIYGPDGEVIGHAIGFSTVIAKRPSDGHLISTYAEAVEIGEDTLRTTATVDRTAVIAGGWARFDAIGTGGAFAGLRGTRRWRLAPPLYDPPRPEQHVDMEIVLWEAWQDKVSKLLPF